MLVVLGKSGYQGLSIHSARGALFGQFLKVTINELKPKVSKTILPSGR